LNLKIAYSTRFVAQGNSSGESSGSKIVVSEKAARARLSYYCYVMGRGDLTKLSTHSK
jgi:hypothetical protein